uniref:Transposase n=1 Tax=Ascaris lumbricoides TaxID=6252 RepID=A0A0M3I0L6_ASCLU
MIFRWVGEWSTRTQARKRIAVELNVEVKRKTIARLSSLPLPFPVTRSPFGLNAISPICSSQHPMFVK